MATGMEMMVTAILRAAGVDAEQVKSDITNYGKQLAEKIASMDAALTALKKDQAELIETVEGLRVGQTVLSDLIYEVARGLRGPAALAPPINGEAKYVPK